MYTCAEKKRFGMKKRLFKAFLFTAFLCTPFQGVFSSNFYNQNKQDASASINTPEIENQDKQKETNSLNTAVNRFFNAKEIVFDSVTMKITLDTLNKDNNLVLTLTDLDIDLANASSLNFNFKTTAKIEYKGLKLSLDCEYRSDDYLYISNSTGNAIKCSIPLTLNDLINTIKTLGINVTFNSTNGNVSLTSLINVLRSAASSTDLNNTSDSQLAYNLSLDDTTFGTTKIQNLNLLLLADKENNPTGFKTNEDILFSNADGSGNTTSLSLDAKIKKTNTVSSYSSTIGDYTDITDNDSSLFGTLTDIFKGKYGNTTDGSTKNRFSIGMSAKIQKKTDSENYHESYLNGDLSADVSNILDDENTGTYSLILSQNEREDMSGDSLNDLSIYFKKETTYLSLNSLFKGRISNSKLSEIFSTITQLTENLSFRELDKNLNLILNVAKKGNLSKLLDGDYSLLNGLLKNYQFSNSSFSITIDGSLFSIANDITLSIHFNETEENQYEVKNIQIDEVNLNDVVLKDITLSLKDYIKPTIPSDDDYPSYDKGLNLFDTLSDIVDSKKISADYSLIFTDQQDVTFNASGKISADVSNATIQSNDTTKTLYTDTGNYYLSFDLPQDENNRDSILGQGIEMYYSGTDKRLYFGYQYDQNEEYSQLESGNYYVFRNSLATSDIQSMYSLIDSKVDNTSSNTSNSISEMSTILSSISNSEAFQELKTQIKNSYSLKGLDGVISTSADENGNIILQLDPSTFLEGSSYETNTSTITITLSNTSDIVSLSASGKVDGCTISFRIQLTDEIQSYTKFNVNDYPQVSDSESLLSSLVSLPTDLKTFDLSIDGKITEDGSDIPTLEIEQGSGISADLSQEKKEASGVLSLKHKDINDSTKQSSSQKLEFSYQQTDGTTTSSSNKEVDKSEFLLEYNDKMHVKMGNDTLYSIMDTINGVDSDSNLLFRYLKFLNSTLESSGSPLMDVINGKAFSVTGIFAKPYFKSLEFHDGYIQLKFDPKLVKSDCKDGGEVTIKVNYSTTEKKITGASLSAKYISSEDKTYNVDLNLALSSYGKAYTRTTTTDTSLCGTDKNILTYVDGTTNSYFVDVDGFKILLQCVVDTTENNFMEIEGELKLQVDLSILTDISLTSVTAKAYAAIYIENETAYAYIRINAFGLSISENDYRVSEFFIKEKEVYCNQTTTTQSTKKEWSGLSRITYYQYTTTSTYYKTTSENITNNIAYYILDYSMDLSRVKVLGISAGQTALNSIYDAMNSSSSSASISNDFSQVIQPGTIYDEQNNSFKLQLNLKDFLSISPASIDSLSLTLKHADKTTLNNKEYKPLSSLSIDGTLSVSVVKITLDSSTGYNTFKFTKLQHISTEEAKSTYMTRYFQFKDLIKDDVTSDYIISSITQAAKPNTNDNYKTVSLTSDWSKSSDYTLESEYFYAW
jgi:hypothetical protein